MAVSRRRRPRRRRGGVDDEPEPPTSRRPIRGRLDGRHGPSGASSAGRCAGPPSLADRAHRAVSVTALPLVITTVVMMNVVHFNPLNPSADLIFDHTTPTGGDMGAHVWGPAFLRDHLLPNFQLYGWSMDWYAGMPVYRFYMVVPALAIVALDTSSPTAWRSSSSPSPGWSACRSAAGRSAAWPASATRCRSCSPSPAWCSPSTRASASTAATSSRRWPASSRSRSPSA